MARHKKTSDLTISLIKSDTCSLQVKMLYLRLLERKKEIWQGTGAKTRRHACLSMPGEAHGAQGMALGHLSSVDWSLASVHAVGAKQKTDLGKA